MTNEEADLLEKFRHNIFGLRNTCTKLKNENAELQNEMTLLRKELEDLKEQKQAAEKAYENLKLAEEISFSVGDRELARKRINKMVREIDKCIAQLDS